MFRYHYLENLPEVFSNYFSRNDEIHHYNTRTSSQLHKSYKRTNYAKHIPIPTKELISGTIWILLIKTLNLMILSKRKLTSTYYTLIKNCRNCKYSL